MTLIFVYYALKNAEAMGKTYLFFPWPGFQVHKPGGTLTVGFKDTTNYIVKEVTL